MYIVVIGVLVVAGVLTALMLKWEIPQALSIPTVIAITAITGGIGYWMLSQRALLVLL